MSDSPTPDVSLREKAERAHKTALGAWFAREDHVCTQGGGEFGQFIVAASPEVVLDLLSRVERAEADSKRLAALERELDGEGSLTFTVWASEQFSIDGLEDSIGPRESLTALLDALGEVHDGIDASGDDDFQTTGGY